MHTSVDKEQKALKRILIGHIFQFTCLQFALKIFRSNLICKRDICIETTRESESECENYNYISKYFPNSWHIKFTRHNGMSGWLLRGCLSSMSFFRRLAGAQTTVIFRTSSLPFHYTPPIHIHIVCLCAESTINSRLGLYSFFMFVTIYGML